ncbi:hypothetical protein ACIP10_15510 [Streptomyces galbus]|uniref:hypothetical protein n=1 Tax=Streptomyces galbus TaxID=33898 RepID=UPI0037A8950B
MTAVDLLAEAHRLKRERSFGARRIADELGITRHAATLLLRQPLPQPVAEVAERERQPVAEVAERTASHRQPVAEAAPARPDRLVIDLRLYPGLRDRLAELAGSGVDAEELIVQAVAALAAGYREGLANGRIRQGPFEVREVVVGPLRPGYTRPTHRRGPIHMRDIRVM